MSELVTVDWLVITTGIPYGQNTKGHLVIEGVGLGTDCGECHRTQIAWVFEGDALVKGKALVMATNKFTQEISIINNNGKTGFKIPGGEGAHAIVSYVWTSDGYDDILGWTVDKVSDVSRSGSYQETELKVVQVYHNDNEEIPVGVPIPWVGEVVPDGFLPYTGNGFDVEAFPKLAKFFPNGVLLNLTGDVLRAAEVGRTIMSKQGQSVQPLGFAGDPHSHGYTYAYNNGYTTGGGGGGRPRHATNTQVTSTSVTTGKITGTGTETRMANTAVKYMTKAG